MKSIYNLRDDELNSIISIDGFDDMKVTTLYSSLSSKWGPLVKIGIKNKNISIYPCKVDKDDISFEIIRIPFKDIEYYVPDGEVYHEQVISGGGSGKINVGGAIVGTVIAGAPGMVLGGQRKVNEVKSTTVEHDTRKLKLLYKKGGITETVYLHSDCYDFFIDNLPEKDHEVVMANKKNKHIKSSSDVGVKDKIKELKEMLDEGLITEEEFETKKKALLDDM